MPNIVPNVPYKEPVTDDRGLMTQSWVGFFRQLIERVGGSKAATNTELGEVTNTIPNNLTTILTSLQSRVSSLESQTAGLDLGRQL